MFIAVVEYENFRCFIHVNAVKLFSVKNKKNEQNANEDDLFPYVLHNLTNFTKLAEIFFYLSNYITIHLYLYNFEFFYRIWKAQKKRCPKSQQLNLIQTENRHSFSSPMLTGKTVTLQNMWSVLKRKWKSHVQPLVCQFYTEFSIV